MGCGSRLRSWAEYRAAITNRALRGGDAADIVQSSNNGELDDGWLASLPELGRVQRLIGCFNKLLEQSWVGCGEGFKNGLVGIALLGPSCRLAL